MSAPKIVQVWFDKWREKNPDFMLCDKFDGEQVVNVLWGMFQKHNQSKRKNND